MFNYVFRLEKEKMLVWSSFLEVEMCYGTEDSLDHIKRRALQQMDELKVYQELVKLYSKLQKVEVCLPAVQPLTR